MEKFYDIPVLGGFGADGFSGCSKRIGPDIDKNTSSRYFLGFKANGILKRHMIVTHTLKHNSYIYQYISFFYQFLILTSLLSLAKSVINELFSRVIIIQQS